MELPWFLAPHLLSFAKECKKVKAKGHAKQAAASLSEKDQETIERIQQQTRDWNGDNFSRTSAYLTFYQKRPEVQWALLAHLVSRNAGWNMTDLRGEFLPRLLSANYYCMRKASSNRPIFFIYSPGSMSPRSCRVPGITFGKQGIASF